jgi:hypothetical protein
MNDGQIHYAWVDYDGSTQTLSARISDTPTRPVDAFVAANLNLVNILKSPNAFVGFTAATGSYYSDHEIIAL